MQRPDLEIEAAAGAAAGRRVCGIDEVGRGPLAGPVIAVAVILPPHGLPSALAAEIDDSKRLSRAVRERLDASLRPLVAFGVGRAEVAEIDRINILRATELAMRRAVEALPAAPDLALVDGNRVPALGCPARAVVGGDRRCLSIAAASILAKVARDREMATLARAFPGYGWERNAGYGTAEHRASLARLGPTPHHRCSFAPVRAHLL